MLPSSPAVRVRHTTPPRYFRCIEVGSVLACLASSAILARSLYVGVQAARPYVLVLVLVAIAAYLAADLVSGLVHFVGDSFGTIHTPWLGRTFVLPFRAHHEDPDDIRRHDFVETNGNNAFASLAAVVPTILFVPVERGGGAALFGLFVLVFTLFVLMTNQIHKWAHLPSPPRLVRALQRAGLLLSPEEHLAHHRPPHGRGYCVTSGIFNRLLDPIGFFPRLEHGIRLLIRRPVRPS